MNKRIKNHHEPIKNKEDKYTFNQRLATENEKKDEIKGSKFICARKQ